jgi:hypothetical protein
MINLKCCNDYTASGIRAFAWNNFKMEGLKGNYCLLSKNLTSGLILSKNLLKKLASNIELSK